MAASSLLTIVRLCLSAAHTPSGHQRPARVSVPFHHRFPGAPTVHLGVPDGLRRGRRRQQQQQEEVRRGDYLLARAGPPSTATLAFAFIFPLSLIIGTVFASARIADQLDEKFLEELAMNKAIMEEKEGSEDETEEDEEDEAPATFKDEQFITVNMEAAATTPRTRNRPKREA